MDEPSVDPEGPPPAERPRRPLQRISPHPAPAALTHNVALMVVDLEAGERLRAVDSFRCADVPALARILKSLAELGPEDLSLAAERVASLRRASDHAGAPPDQRRGVKITPRATPVRVVDVDPDVYLDSGSPGHLPDLGQTFPSIRAAARGLGFHEVTLAAYLHRAGRGVPVTFRGLTLQTL